ncbi:RTA1 like protein [Hirsutella rhossiliensis]|uniref:RTA1 like protein n=1 Tax=Hirsutella rhossiliensis TaxID=111463 RepID=A0A9P8MUS1_9HYPO|nr:RTA1 like protein [Hirsutella rhossiliensis]KAH0960809.1 RTA1 like protein [Hirsutella rhossiliensis]
MAQLKPFRGNFYLWDYVPSKPAAILLAILFGLATLVVVWRMVRTRTLFSIAFALGGLFEIAGYGARAVAEDKTDQLGPYVVQSILILVAPALYAASIYMTLGRLMRSVQGERHSLVPVRWLTRAFVAGDVLSFLMQGSGGGLMGMGNFSQETAQNIILGGLVVQVVMFGLFAITAVVFDVRIRRWPTGGSLEGGGQRWMRAMLMLYATTALILVRCVVRVVEYVMGKDGYLLRYEWTLYVFDAVPMLAVTVVYGWVYPGELTAANTKAWPREQASSLSGHEGMGLADGLRTRGGGHEK